MQFFMFFHLEVAELNNLVKIFAGSLRILKGLQRPTQIFKDLQRSYKDPPRQETVKEAQRFHKDLFKMLLRSWQRSLQ